MKEQEIIEGNKLIAEFMGWDKFHTGTYHTPFDNASFCNGEPTHIVNFPNDLKFNSDWNWLMLVVEKIESVHFEGTDQEVWVDVLIQSETCHIVEETRDFETIEKIGVNKLEAVWLACVEFIKWYNYQTHS